MMLMSWSSRTHGELKYGIDNNDDGDNREIKTPTVLVNEQGGKEKVMHYEKYEEYGREKP